MDWDIVAKDDYEYEWVKESIKEVKEFLKYPNKNRESFTTIIRALIKDILEIDAGVIVKVFDRESYNFEELEPKSGAPLLKPKGERTMTELYARDGASFLKETDKFGFTAGYWQYSYQIPAHPMWFDKDEVCYVLRNQRSMSVYGFAPTQSIMDIIKSLHYSTLYNKRFFEETAIPDGVLSVLDTSEVEMRNFVDNWKRDFQAQPHKFAVLNKDVKWQPFTISQRELEFLETQSWYYKLVISAFGLTPSELGLTDELNRSTSSTQAELSRRKGIRPLMHIIECFINEEVIPEFNVEGIEFQFIYDDPSEKAQRLANWQVEVNMGIKTPNEVREEMGLNPIDGGDLPRGLNTYGMSAKPGVNADEDAAKDESERTFDNEEGKATKKSAVLPSVEDSKKERDNLIMHPDHVPVPDQSGVVKKADYKLMSYDELISEHKRLVNVLESGSEEGIKREAEEQKKELEIYIQERTKSMMSKKLDINEQREIIDLIYSKLSRDLYLILQRAGLMSSTGAANISNLLQQRGRIKGHDTYARCDSSIRDNDIINNFFNNICVKGMDDGQYYREQTRIVTQLPDQPQNSLPSNHTVSLTENRPASREVSMTCPQCGHNVLKEESGMDSLYGDLTMYRCLNCNSLMRDDDLVRMEDTMMSNPMGKNAKLFKCPNCNSDNVKTWYLQKNFGIKEEKN